jgi:glucosylglycerate synthase
MSDKELLTPEAREQISAVGPVDLVVGVAARDGAGAALEAAQAGLTERFPGLRAVVIHAHAGGDGQPAPTGDGSAPVLDLPCRATPSSGGTGTGPWPRMTAVRMVFEASQRMRVRGCAVLDAEVLSLTPDWVGRLLAPVLDRDFDLVAPYYVRHPFNGAVSTGILYPLTRALSGRRLRYPHGGEFACSARLVERLLGSELWHPRTGPGGIDPWLIANTAPAGFRSCQSVLGPRTLAAGDATIDLTAILAEVLAPVFAEMQRSTAVWQKVRGSTPLELIGDDPAEAIEPVSVDIKRLLDAFRLGQQNLRDVWGLVLPPSTLVELKKLARMPDPDFRLPDQMWARIIYDFSLAYYLRSMSREHLMGALAPLYLGWFGSIAAEMGDADPGRLEARLERLCLLFESEKPYLISRWRWPDRFNP